MNAPIDLQEIAPGLVNPSCPTADVYTGGQPGADDFPRLAAAGIRTILDLRPEDEPRGFDEPAAARAAGIEYVHLPVRYTGIPAETFDRFRELMRASEKRPVLVHCRSGNRVGAVLVPYLILDEGKSPQEALDLAVEAGLTSQFLFDVAMEYTRQQAASQDR